MAHLMRVRFLPDPEVRMIPSSRPPNIGGAGGDGGGYQGENGIKEGEGKDGGKEKGKEARTEDDSSPGTKKNERGRDTAEIQSGERVQQVAGILERGGERGTSRVLLDSLIHIHPAPNMYPVPRVLKLVWPATAAATVALHFALYDTGRGKARLRLKPRLTRGTWKELQFDSLHASLCLLSESQTHKWVIRQFDLSRGYSFSLQPGTGKVFKLTVEILIKEAKGQACRDLDLRRRVFKEVDLKRRILAGMTRSRKCCDCRAEGFPRNNVKVEHHPEEEVEKDEDEDDKWWEEKETPVEVVKKKEVETVDPWMWRGLPSKKKDKKKDKSTQAANLDDFDNDDMLKGFGGNQEVEDDGDICNFDLDLYSGDF